MKTGYPDNVNLVRDGLSNPCSRQVKHTPKVLTRGGHPTFNTPPKPTINIGGAFVAGASNTPHAPGKKRERERDNSIITWCGWAGRWPEGHNVTPKPSRKKERKRER